MAKIPAPNFTQVPNILIEKLMPVASPAEFKCIMVIIRMTIGFHRQQAEISYNTFIKLTGLSKQGILKALKKLEAQSWVGITRPGNNKRNIYSLDIDCDDLDKEEDQPSDENEPDLGNSVHHSGELSSPPLGNSVHPSPQSLKKELNKTNKEREAKASNSQSKDCSNTPPSKSKFKKKKNALTDQERQKLIDKYGLENTNAAIKELEEWKETQTDGGGTKKKDYARITHWVMKKVIDNKAGVNQPKQVFQDKVKATFKHGQFYNGAECFIDDNNIAFQRGMKHQQVKWREFGFQDQFEKMLHSFGIPAVYVK